MLHVVYRGSGKRRCPSSQPRHSECNGFAASAAYMEDVGVDHRIYDRSMVAH